MQQIAINIVPADLGNSSQEADCSCPKACFRETFQESLSFAPLSEKVSASFWQWGESKFHRKRRQAINTRHRVDDNSMVETMAGLQEIQEAIKAFYDILLDRFISDSSNVIEVIKSSIRQLKEIQLADLKKRLVGSLTNFQISYATNIRQPLISAKMAGNRALEMVQQLNSLLASIRDELNVSKIAQELEVINAALHIANSRILAAFRSFEYKTDDYVPDNIVENRYKRLQRCLEERDMISVLTPRITQMVNQITQTMDLENNNCPLFKFPVYASSTALVAGDDQRSLGCALAKSISRYLSALHVVQPCLTDYENLLTGWDSWLANVETALRKVAFSSTAYNSNRHHLEQRAKYLGWIGNIRDQYAAGTMTIFDVQSNLCDITANQMLQGTEYAIQNIETDVVIPVKYLLQEISPMLAGHYAEGLKRLSLFCYYFEDPTVREFLEKSARALDIWRRPISKPEHRRVSFFLFCFLYLIDKSIAPST